MQLLAPGNPALVLWESLNYPTWRDQGDELSFPSRHPASKTRHVSEWAFRESQHPASGLRPSRLWSSTRLSLEFWPTESESMINDCFMFADWHETLPRLMELLRVSRSCWFPLKSCLNSSMLDHEGVSQVHRKKKWWKWSITGKAFFLKGKFIKVLELDLPAISSP